MLVRYKKNLLEKTAATNAIQAIVKATDGIQMWLNRRAEYRETHLRQRITYSAFSFVLDTSLTATVIVCMQSKPKARIEQLRELI